MSLHGLAGPEGLMEIFLLNSGKILLSNPIRIYVNLEKGFLASPRDDKVGTKLCGKY